MDRNEALRQIRLALAVLRSETASEDAKYDAATDLAEHVEALDHWLNMDGFLPEAWREGSAAVGRTAMPDSWWDNEGGVGIRDDEALDGED